MLKNPEPIIFFIETLIIEKKDFVINTKESEIDSKVIKPKLINYYQQLGINMVLPGEYENLIREDVYSLIANQKTRTAILKKF